MTSNTLQTIEVLIYRIRYLSNPYVFASAGITFLLSLFLLYRRLEPATANVPFYGQIPNNPGAQKKRFIMGSQKLLLEGYRKVCCCVHHASP